MTVSEGNSSESVKETSTDATGPSMKRVSRVSSSGHDNPGLELSDAVSSQSMQQYTDSRTSVISASVVRSVSQWASYARGRWKQATCKCMRRKPSEESLSSKYKGLAWEEDAVDGITKEYQLNKSLLDHFRVLAANNEDTDKVDLQYLNEILSDGADPNSADKYGQTALHEISRAWNVDVMRFFLERGADICRPDAFGVTPLHVAAALDYEDMIHFLLERGADIEAHTYKDLQTPLHFAAKNNAIEAIQILLQNGADIAAHDYKQRTPLQLAVNLDRSEAAHTLLEMGADAGVQDSDGQLCIAAMIGKMTPVANLALNQFHVKDRMTRQQFFYLHLLEPERTHLKKSQGKNRNEPKSPLEFIVHQGKLDLIMHPVVLKLITVKWNLYGRLGAWILLLLNFLFIVSWTTVAISVSVSSEEDKRYVFPQDWWRVFVVMIALGLTVLEVYREVMEILHSVRKLKDWQQWCEQRLNEDLACTHPMWPEERHYIEGQIKLIRNMKGSYSQDPWNIFDWLVYALLIAVLGLHLADVYLVSQTLQMYSLRIFAVAVIFLWLRLMKHVRAFRVMGPFIVMLGKIVGDVLRFLFLYAEIYVPYACAFWIIFGGLTAVPSMQTVPQMLYSLYRITLVDEYEFDAMVAVDPVMAHLLCGTFLALSAVLCVNLMIALLSDTFQRVYDNALANAVMQQASIILQVEESMPHLRHFYDKQYIHSCCSPLREPYDDDIITNPDQHEEMKKLTAEIKDTLDEYLAIQKEAKLLNTAQTDDGNSSPRWNSSSSQQEHLSSLMRLEKNQQQQFQDLQDLREDVKKLQGLLLQLIQSKPTTSADVPNTYSTVLR
ncbi:transient receptor potential cation channel subfamily A member 1 isoform X2 [Ictalurus punctatus]|uniref:Transient receptor potential cation channel subfamily A member 1 isoform X2 n=1 Tax=Ictalurus punctatus TaxID=7998 RepID=A0A9F7R354_ICTPU|nr:transient receptor potential cation channel subfamily A member 1 isoform X2 [Ictalurus punctatus]